MSYLIVLSLFILPLILWRKFYPFRLTGIQVHNDSTYDVISLKPTKKGFRDIYPGEKVCCCRLGDYVAFYSQESKDKIIQYNDYRFGSDIVVLAAGRFGRLRSLDLTARSLKKIINNIGG